MAKGQKTGGRKKGSPNKRTTQFQHRVASEGITPLEYMLQVLRDASAEYSRRDDMAKAAAPYIHSKMPAAIVLPPAQSATVADDDETLLDAYLHGLHEADED